MSRVIEGGCQGVPTAFYLTPNFLKSDVAWRRRGPLLSHRLFNEFEGVSVFLSVPSQGAFQRPTDSICSETVLDVPPGGRKISDPGPLNLNSAPVIYTEKKTGGAPSTIHQTRTTHHEARKTRCVMRG